MKNLQRGFAISIVIAAIALLVVGGGIYVYTSKNVEAPADIPIACTMDAMQCPDGSYVGRSGPKCEFVCPKTSDIFYLEREVIHQPSGGKIMVIRTNNEEYIRECITKPKETKNLPEGISSSVQVVFVSKNGHRNVLQENNLCTYKFDNILFSPDGNFVSFSQSSGPYMTYFLFDLATMTNLNKDTYINFTTIRWNSDSTQAVIRSDSNIPDVKTGDFIFDVKSNLIY